MTETKFTPGYWQNRNVAFDKDEWERLRCGAITCVTQQAGAAVIATVWGDDPDNETANAHLIAAAPDMYAALEKAPILSKYHGGGGFDVERFVGDYEDWMGHNRNVRGKARGET